VRILFVNPVGILGGAERSLLDLIVSMRAAYPSWDLSVALMADGPFVEAVESLGVRVHSIPMPHALAELGDSMLAGTGGVASRLGLLARTARAGLGLRGYLRRFRSLAERERPDLIHSNGNKSHLVTSLAAAGGAPVLWHVRDFLGSRRLMARALRWARKGAAGSIAISGAVRRDIEATFPGLPVDVVYNGVDVDIFAPAPGDGTKLDALAGLRPAGQGVVRVGLVGTYAIWKGHMLFLDAAARAIERLSGDRVRFYVVGGAVYSTRGSQVAEADLRARAAALGIAEHVGFVGFQREVADSYRDLDIVAHASIQPEPFGRTIVEAMACGRAVIVSRSGGAAELFTHGHDAVGVSPGSVEELASAVVSLATNPGERRRLGEEARRTAVTRFSRARLGPEVGRIYERLLRPNAS